MPQEEQETTYKTKYNKIKQTTVDSIRSKRMEKIKRVRTAPQRA